MAVYKPETALAGFFWALSYKFYAAGPDPVNLFWIFLYLAETVKDVPIWGETAEWYFLRVASKCYDICYFFRDSAQEIDAWWVTISDTWDDLSTLWTYTYTWLTDTANNAYGWAIVAYNWAAEALARASEALTEIPAWVLTKLADAYDAAVAIAGVIGTTFSQIVQFVKDHAEAIYQTINEFIYNTYNTFKEYITNVYETIQNFYYTYITEIIGVAEDWVRDFVAAALAPFAAPINLVNLWFDDIQNFFNDPLGSLLSWLEGIAKKHESALLAIFNRVMEALWS